MSPDTADLLLPAGFLLVHLDAGDVDAALLERLDGRSGSGLVVQNAGVTTLRHLARNYSGLVVADAGRWRKEIATTEEPFGHGIGAEGLVTQSLDTYAASLALAGAAVVLTPSRFVRSGDWDVLRSVVSAGQLSERPDVVTLVVTDAAMLESPHLSRFVDELQGSTRQLALIFCSKGRPFEGAGRARALRELLKQLPLMSILATEPLVATDVVARGGSASIGYRSSLRHPRRPFDKGGPANAAGFLPGLFLRDLWEHRSPDIYADWYVSTPSPTCDPCGRALDSYEKSDSDKREILLHNVHAWLDVLADLGRRSDLPRRQQFLVGERLSALSRHIALHPFSATHQADMLLRRLAELDDPLGRTLLPSGAWR